MDLQAKDDKRWQKGHVNKNSSYNVKLLAHDTIQFVLLLDHFGRWYLERVSFEKIFSVKK